MLAEGFTQKDIDEGLRIYGPVGCKTCCESGYKGRVGIFQVMGVSDETAHIIMSGGNADDIAVQAEPKKVSGICVARVWKRSRTALPVSKK